MPTFKDLVDLTATLPTHADNAAAAFDRLGSKLEKVSNVSAPDFNQGTGGGAAGVTGTGGSGGVTTPGTGPQVDANGKPFFGPSGGGGGASGAGGASALAAISSGIAYDDGKGGVTLQNRGIPSIIGVVVEGVFHPGHPVLRDDGSLADIWDAQGNSLMSLLRSASAGQHSAGGTGGAGGGQTRTTLGLGPGVPRTGNGPTQNLPAPPPPAGGFPGGGSPNVITAGDRLVADAVNGLTQLLLRQPSLGIQVRSTR